MSVSEPDSAVAESPSVSSPRLTAATVFWFLLGRQEAIRTILHCPQAAGVGLLFVISAGFAREYDGESLIDEPWHVFLPLGASLITASILYFMVDRVAARRQVPESPAPSGQISWQQFIGLFWMMAPMAWLYAIPVERFLPAGPATIANLWLLGIVATWRVVLMIRVIQVVYQARTWIDVLSIVLLFSDAVLLFALWLVPTPILQIMGGIRLSDSERVLLDTTLILKLVGFVSLPLWLIGYVVAHRRQPVWPAAMEARPATVGRSVQALAAVSLLVWLPILPVTQQEQMLRYQTEQELLAQRYRAALQRMSHSGQEAYPPHWDPPPRPGFGEDAPPLADIMRMLGRGAAADPWVRRVYLRKYFRSRGRLLRHGWHDEEERGWDYILTLLEHDSLPEACEVLLEEYPDRVEAWTVGSDLSEEQKVRLSAVLQH